MFVGLISISFDSFKKKRYFQSYTVFGIFLLISIQVIFNISVNKFPALAKKVEIIFLDKDHFTEKEWKALYKLSENTFVEETESLKQGAAGAGLTDND